MSAQAKNAGRFREFRNGKVRRSYFVEETVEAGIVLRGTEVKSIRAGGVQINEAFAKIVGGDIVLHNAHIAEYAFGNVNNHLTTRPRKLLLKKREIDKLRAAVESGGKALVPTRLYFKQALVKIELAICTGKKLYDKRQDLKKEAEMREADREWKRHR